MNVESFKVNNKKAKMSIKTYNTIVVRHVKNCLLKTATRGRFKSLMQAIRWMNDERQAQTVSLRLYGV